MKSTKTKFFWVIFGVRYKRGLFWEPNFKYLNIKFVPVLSRFDNDWKGAKGYVQAYSIKIPNWI